MTANAKFNMKLWFNILGAFFAVIGPAVVTVPDAPPDKWSWLVCGSLCSALASAFIAGKAYLSKAAGELEDTPPKEP